MRIDFSQRADLELTSAFVWVGSHIVCSVVFKFSDEN